MESQHMQSQYMQSQSMHTEHETMPIEIEQPISQKKPKAKEEFIIPTKENYTLLLSHNYTIKQLKEIAAHHKIKISSGIVKADIVAKIYNYFKHYDNAVVIQKAWRRYLFKQYNKLRGPARFNRSLCVNETDFFTMDEIKEIPYVQFFSFQDNDSMIYGCDIMSIYTLFQKGFDTKVANPYNRNVLSKNIKKNMMKLIWLSQFFKEEMIFKVNEAEVVEQNISGRVAALFHEIDILGNYTNHQWFLSLGHAALVRFMVELNDIWNYRANLSDQVKRDICPTHRDLFRTMYMVDLRIVPLAMVQDMALIAIEKLIRDGINNDSRCLGANFVLCALTLVSGEAAIALPWLFQSVF